MQAVYLRHRDGHAIGPLSRAAVEVLWDARVIDRSTPVSEDGESYQPVETHGALLDHLEAIKTELDGGKDPWPEHIEVRPKPVSKSMRATGDRDMPTLRLMLGLAVESASGTLRIEMRGGGIELGYRDGKIVTVVTDDPEHEIGTWLEAEGIVDEAQLREARERAPAMGGDIGGALIAGGVIEPHIYFEKLIEWAHFTVGTTLLAERPTRRFEPGDLPPPPVPLGFERYSSLFDAMRAAAHRGILEERLLPHRGRPLIPSQVEGLSFDETRPKPRELRAVKAANGVQTLARLLDKLGGSEEKSTDVLTAILFATEAGFVVMGVDPIAEKEEAEARQLEETLERYQNLNFFELLEVSEKSSDEDTRARYTELAKLYHPDGLRADATAALKSAREKLFAYVSEAFEQIESSDARYQYALDLDAGRVGGASEQAQVQAILESETLFKKAEVLLRMKKYDEALDHVQQAIDRNPEEKEFLIFRSYCNYLSQAKRGEREPAAAVAIKEILGIMKLDANIAVGYLYLGHLNKAVNKPEVALRYFKKVLEYDERHPEATREVRLANARKERSKKGIFGR